MAMETWEFSETIAQGSAREAFAGEIIELARKHKNIYFVTGDSSAPGSKQEAFGEEFPDQFVDVGIQEQAAVGIAAGIALTGKRVFVNAFGPFLSMRSVEQVYLDGAYNHANITVIGTHSGLTSGGGVTHSAIMDLAYMRCMPEMTIIAPTDAEMIKKVMDASIDYDGPIYVRCSRGIEPLVYENTDYEYVIGKSILAKEGNDLTIIGTGCMVYHCVQAAKLLEKEGIHVRVIDMHTIKPLDTEAIIKAAKETPAIVTVEDHGIEGGLGGAVAEVVSSLPDPADRVQVIRLGVPNDRFFINGGPEDLYAYYGYDMDGIYKKVKEILKK